MFVDQLAETKPLLQLTNQDQPSVGSDAGSFEIDFEQAFEAWLKRLAIFFTDRVWTSPAP